MCLCVCVCVDAYDGFTTRCRLRYARRVMVAVLCGHETINISVVGLSRLVSVVVAVVAVVVVVVCV